MLKNKFYKKSLLLYFCLFLSINIITYLLFNQFYFILNLIIILLPFEFILYKDFKNIDFKKGGR